MFCTNCGKKAPEGTKVCPYCKENIIIPDLENKELEKKNNKKNISAPLSTASFFIMQIIFFIPIVNIIFLLIWSFKKNINANQKAFSRSILIWLLIILILLSFSLLALIILHYPLDLNVWFLKFKDFINNIPEN